LDEDDEGRDDNSMARASPASSTHSDDRESKSQLEPEESNDCVQSVSSSWDDKGTSINSQKKLDEWEQMEAKLKAILTQKDTVADIGTINSM
jgi:hypothetical protein